MAWTHCVSDLPMNDWTFSRQIHAVTVDHHIYLFDYNKSCEGDAIQVLIFNPKTSTCRATQSLGRREGGINEVLSSKSESIRFAVAFKDKVYVCVGGRNFDGGEIHVFDTRTLRWSCVITSGDVPSGHMCVRECVCEHDGHVYMYAECISGAYSERTYLWALELSSLRWKILGQKGQKDKNYFPRCIFPHQNRIYVLLEEFFVSYDIFDDEMTYFDLATKTWNRLYPPGRKPCSKKKWISFIHREHLYVFLSDKAVNNNDLHMRFGNIKLNEVVVRYSFARHEWEQVLFKGMTPPDILDLVCVVDNISVFFSLYKKRAYVLDFFPSLRSLCFKAIWKYQLDSTSLPTPLKRELSKYNICLAI